MIHFSLTADKLPYISIKTAELFLYGDERFGVLCRRVHFKVIANNARIGKQGADLGGIVAGDFRHVEMVKR